MSDVILAYTGQVVFTDCQERTECTVGLVEAAILRASVGPSICSNTPTTWLVFQRMLLFAARTARLR